MGTGNPAPEGGAVARTVAADAYGAAATLDDALADGESEAGALNELVELDEAVEDGGLLLLGDAGAGVLAVDVEATLRFEI